MVKDYEIVESLLYKGKEGGVTAEFLVDKANQTFWASQKTVADIFETSPPNISMHMQNIFQDGELKENEVSISSKELFKDQLEFIKESLINSKKAGRPSKWYNLDGIIAVGYRVNSKKATEFRIWATSILKDYIVKGFAIDVELLKNGTRLGEDYFKELLEIIRDIRLSERRFYEQITDIYATAYDYNKDAKITKEFFMNVQNKLHYAVSGHTSPEIIAERADSEKPFMGLETWDNSPNGKIYLKDAKIAKNYLNKKEITELRSIVNMYLDYAENQALRHNPMSMEDWAERLDKFLEFNEYHILKGKGKISRKSIDDFVKKEYEKYRPIQDKLYKSDYNNFIEETKKLKSGLNKN